MVRVALIRFFEAYFRHRWLYLLPLVLMSVLSVVYEVYTPPVYVASASMYVHNESLLSTLTSASTGVSWTTPSQITIGELRELMQTESFVRSAIKQTPLEASMSQGPQKIAQTIALFRAEIDLQTVGDNLISITAKDKTPLGAQQMVTAVVESYVQWRLNGDNQDSIVAQDFFSKIIQPYNDDLEKARTNLSTYLANHPDPVRGDRPTEEQVQIEQLQGAISQAQDRVKSAMDKLENARLSQSKAESEVRQSYAIVDAPALPTTPAKGLRARLQEVVLFVVVGAILSLVVIIGGMLLDRSIRLPLDVQHQLHLPVLAAVPDVHAAMVKMRGRLPSMVISTPDAREAALAGLFPGTHGGEVRHAPIPAALLTETTPVHSISEAVGIVPDSATPVQSAAQEHHLPELNDQQAQEAVQQRYDQSNDLVTRFQCQIVLMALRGRTASQIATTLMADKETVAVVLAQFQARGVAGLPALGPAVPQQSALPTWETELIHVVAAQIQDGSAAKERWTIKSLAAHLKATLQVSIRAETISLCLDRHGYVCKRRVWYREQVVEASPAPASVARSALHAHTGMRLQPYGGS